jgi:tetratricopeptide (TPR) repeat protein
VLPISTREVAALILSAVAQGVGRLDDDSDGSALPRDPQLVGATALEVDPLGAALLQSFPPSGFRLPDRSGVTLQVASVGEAGAHLVYRRAGDGEDRVPTGYEAALNDLQFRADGRVEAAEGALLGGQPMVALETFRALEEGPTLLLARVCTLDLALTYGAAEEQGLVPARLDEWQRDDPDAPELFAFRGRLAERAGERATAIRAYAQAGDAAAARGESEGEIRALLAALDLSPLDAVERTAWLERLVRLRSEDEALAHALFQSYARDRREDDAIRLYPRLIGSTGPGPERVDRLVRLGTEALERAASHLARVLLAEAASSPDAGRDVLLRLAVALDACGADEERLSVLTRLVALAERDADPTYVSTALRDLGRAWLERGVVTRARDLLRRAVDTRVANGLPGDPVLLALLAFASAGLGEREREQAALEAFLQASAGQSGSPDLSPPDAAKRLAEIHLLAGRLDEALRWLKTALDLGAEGEVAARIHHRMAVLHDRGDRPEEAVRSFLEAAREDLEPVLQARAERLCRAGDLYLRKLGRRDQARACFERSIAQHPSHRPTLDGLEALVADAGDRQALADVLRRKVGAATRPQEQRAILVRLAAVEDELGHEAGARDAHTRALAIDPRCVPSLLWLGREALARGDRETAIQRWNALLQIEASPSDGMAADEAAMRADAHEELARMALGGNALSVAERHLRAAQTLSPGRRGVLDKLASILRATPDRAGELADVLALLAAATESPEAAAIIELERAHALEKTGRSANEAAAAYARAAELAPSLDEPLAALAQIHATAGRPVELAAMLERRAELARQRGDEIAAIRLETDAARASSDEARIDGGLARLAPLLPPGTARAAVVVERARRALVKDELEEARALLVAEGDASGSPEVATLLAEVDERRRVNGVGAVGASSGAGEPSRAASATVNDGLDVEALALIQASGRTAETARILEERARGAAEEGSSRQASRLLYWAGRIQLEDLAEVDTAATLLERALLLAPHDGEVVARLETALTASGEFARLAGAYELHLGTLSGRARSRPLSALADLYLRYLGDRDKSGVLLAEAVAVDPTRSDLLVPLGDYHFEAGEGAPALDYYTKALSLARLEPGARARVRQRIGDLLLDAGEMKKAEQWFRRALDDDPRLENALAGLERIFRRRADKAGLAFVLVARAGLARGPRTIGLLKEAADLYADVGRLDDANGLGQRILILEGQKSADGNESRSAVSADDDTTVALAALEADVETAQGSQRAALLVELAALLATQGEIDRAERCLGEAVTLDPTSERAVRAYAEALGRAGKHEEMCRLLAAALDQLSLSAEAEAALAIRLGHAYAEGLGNLEAAIGAFERAARRAELPVDARETMAGLYRATGRQLALADVLQSLADGETGSRRIAWLQEAADLVAQEGTDLRRAADLSWRLFREDPARREAGLRARRLYAAVQDDAAAETVVALELRTAQPAERPVLRAARAAILLRQGKLEEADGELQAALVAAPDLGAAHFELGRLLAARGQSDAAQHHFDAAVRDETLDPATRAEASHTAGVLHEQAARTTQAIERYELASTLDPTDRRPLEKLDRLYEARQDFAALTEILGRLILVSPDRQERARLWHRRGRLYRDRLAREPETYRCLKEAVANDPTFAPALADLRAMAEARGEWALAAELCYGEIAQATDSALRARLYLELGKLLGEKLLDHEQSVRVLEQALAVHSANPDPSEIKEALAEAYRQAGRVPDALHLLGELASVAGPTHRERYLLRQAQHLEALGRKAEAEARYREVLASGKAPAATSDAAIAQLAKMEGGEARSDAQADIEARLKAARTTEERQGRLEQLLRLAVEAGDGDDAEGRARALLELDADHPAAHEALARVLRERASYAELEVLLQARLARANDGRKKASALFELARVRDVRGQPAEAGRLLEQALSADPTHLLTLQVLAEQAYRRRDLLRARDLHARLAEIPDVPGRDLITFRRGEIEEVAGDPRAALEFYRQALVANRGHLPSLGGVARVALQQGDLVAASQALRDLLAHLPLDAVDRITELRQQLGEVLARLGADEEARGYFELVLAQEPDRAATLAPLAAVYQRLGVWDRAVEVLGRLASLASSPQAKAEVLVRQGDIFRDHLQAREKAGTCYLKAIDLAPDHVPTLARLTDYAWVEGDLAMLEDVGTELRRLTSDAEQSAELLVRLALAGLISEHGDADVPLSLLRRGLQKGIGVERSAMLLAQGAQTATAAGRDPSRLDPALQLLTRTSADPSWLERLGATLRGRLGADLLDVGAHHVLARTAILSNRAAIARPHLGILTFLGDAFARDALGALPVAQSPASSVFAGLFDRPPIQPPPSLASHLKALRALALPLQRLGGPAVPPGARRIDRPVFAELAADLAIPSVEVWAVTATLHATVITGVPVRLVVGEGVLALPDSELKFFAARALSLFRLGDALLEGRDAALLERLVRAVASCIDRQGPRGEVSGEIVRHLELPRDGLPADQVRAVQALADAGSTVDLVVIRRLLREAADRIALIACGSLPAALSALARLEGLAFPTRRDRERAIRSTPALRSLVEHATRPSD